MHVEFTLMIDQFEQAIYYEPQTEKMVFTNLFRFLSVQSSVHTLDHQSLVLHCI